MGYFGLLLIVLGEALSIIAEMLIAQQPSWRMGLTRAWPLITLGGALLIFGYGIAYAHLRDIWIITAVSVGAILVVEPTLAYIFFKTLPEKGALIGLVLGAVGIVSTLAWR